MTKRQQMIHDLMNQLGIIAGMSDLLLLELPHDDPHRRDIELIAEAVRRANTVAGALGQKTTRA